MRCFIALDLPREAIKRIEEIQELIQKKNLFIGKFTESENLHLTLKFLGEISEEQVQEARKKLQEIKFNEFDASLGEVGVFSKRSLKIVWVKLNGKGVFDLQEKIDRVLSDLFQPETRFMGHITIARVKKVFDKETLVKYLKDIKIKDLKFKTDKFFLKKSDLKPEGPTYEDLLEVSAEK